MISRKFAKPLKESVFFSVIVAKIEDIEIFPIHDFFDFWWSSIR